ncbi:MAG: hypothetical protein K2J11_03620 [Oscillospiraceae bacterium]|nr:hypothetical protein [Oscillospiraceae bacterium]
MSPNENDFLNGGMLNGGDGGYVPKFERELQNAGGNLSALAKEKAAESADSIDMEIDVSSLRSSFEEEAGTSDDASEIEIEVADEYDGNEEAAETSADEADIDFIYDEDYQYSGRLEDISVESIALDNIDVKLEEMRTDKSSMISSLKNQMQADDLAMSVENRPKLDEMSDEYFPSHRKSEDIMSKEQLDKDEKELIKNRLKTEMEKKPEGFDKKKSLAMYKKLMDEQKAKAAKRGFIMLLITAAMGFASAVLIYFAKPNAGGDQPLLDYLPVGAIVFALFMMVKSKFAKIMSTLFFTACTVMLIYPGLFSYAFNPENQSAKNYVIQLIIYVAAIAMCAVTFIRLLTNKDIEEYYSYKPSSGNRRGR